MMKQNPKTSINCDGLPFGRPRTPSRKKMISVHAVYSCQPHAILLFLFLHYALIPLGFSEPTDQEETSELLMAFELETVDTMLVHLSAIIDWKKLAEFKGNLDPAAFDLPFNLDHSALQRLPEEMRRELTDGLILRTDLIERPEAKKVILASEPLPKNLPSEISPFTPPIKQNKSSAQPTPKGLVDPNGNALKYEPNPWPEIQRRWKKLWTTLALLTRESIYPVEALSLNQRALLLRKALRKRTAGLKHRSMVLPIKETASTKARNLFERIVLSLDVNGALEFKHEKPVDDEIQFINDLDMLLELTGTTITIKNPNYRDSHHSTATYHLHLSRKDRRNLSHFRNALNLLYLVRYAAQGRADEILGDKAIGNVRFSSNPATGNSIVRAARGWEPYVEALPDRFEVKGHTKSPKEELKELVSLLKLSDESGVAKIYQMLSEELTEAALTAIGERDFRILDAFAEESMPELVRNAAKQQIEKIIAGPDGLRVANAQLWRYEGSNFNKSYLPSLAVIERLYPLTLPRQMPANMTKAIREHLYDSADALRRIFKGNQQELIRYLLEADQWAISPVLSQLNQSETDALYFATRGNLSARTLLSKKIDQAAFLTEGGQAWIRQVLNDPEPMLKEIILKRMVEEFALEGFFLERTNSDHLNDLIAKDDPLVHHLLIQGVYSTLTKGLKSSNFASSLKLFRTYLESTNKTFKKMAVYQLLNTGTPVELVPNILDAARQLGLDSSEIQKQIDSNRPFLDEFSDESLEILGSAFDRSLEFATASCENSIAKLTPTRRPNGM